MRNMSWETLTLEKKPKQRKSLCKGSPTEIDASNVESNIDKLGLRMAARLISISFSMTQQVYIKRQIHTETNQSSIKYTKYVLDGLCLFKCTLYNTIWLT